MQNRQFEELELLFKEAEFEVQHGARLEKTRTRAQSAGLALSVIDSEVKSKHSRAVMEASSPFTLAHNFVSLMRAYAVYRETQRLVRRAGIR